MGGEATYRFARHRPEAVAGIAVLCGFDPAHFPASKAWGYQPIEDPVERLRGIPVLVVHGRDDSVVPLEAAQQTVDDLVAAGVQVRFTILEHHDHDVWTDTYADPALIDWLVSQRRS
jgi:predicted peptidase